MAELRLADWADTEKERVERERWDKEESPDHSLWFQYCHPSGAIIPVASQTQLTQAFRDFLSFRDEETEPLTSQLTRSSKLCWPSASFSAIPQHPISPYTTFEVKKQAENKGRGRANKERGRKVMHLGIILVTPKKEEPLSTRGKHRK